MIVIATGSDHTGVKYKYLINNFLKQKGYGVKDFGSYHEEKAVDYPDFIHPTSKYVDKGKAYIGIVLCGSGNGAAMTANKYKNVRAALVWNEKIAFLAKRHNNANIMSIPSRFVNENQLLVLVDIFLKTPFKGGRHLKRINKI
ncbi:RpiB/LacA/LacB family sugar-phosphate isomerase [Blattabacterium cuenoti]|uniref:RpiB/LacA/LacB family sugar-phosphate isomerase n=1 Tax=Blattabacterium cuenoti TaxID=1653831 RepID=UPI00293BBEE5|nr:RpiB/LacA/LacB family sugar-phosphate isomerase [Blattabacterium cuenoti]